MILHELGHTMGLAHPPLDPSKNCGGQTSQATVMNSQCGVNDAGGNMPQGVKECDNQKVTSNPTYATAGGGGGGDDGGGGGGGGGYDAGGGGCMYCDCQYDTEYRYETGGGCTDSYHRSREVCGGSVTWTGSWSYDGRDCGDGILM